MASTTMSNTIFTLEPSLAIAHSDRGRGLNDWESARIKYHYDTGITSPKFGVVIDTSDMTLEQVADKVLQIVAQ